MQLSEIEKLITLIGSFGAGAVLSAGIIYLFIRSYIPSYLAEKAKNLATKEDIEGITHEVESVKSGYAELLEEVRSDHQIKIAAIEREKTIKKEVYMEAVEAITRSQNMIANFANLNLTQESITNEFSQDAGKIAKVQIVGSKETVKSISNFMSEIGTVILDLTLSRTDLTSRIDSVKTHENLRDKSQLEVDRYLAIMKNLNLEGNQNPGAWDAVNRSFYFERAQIKEQQSIIDELWEIQNSEHLVYSRRCMDSFFQVSQLLPATVLSVRKELDLDISSEDYLDIFNENIERGKETIGSFLNIVENGKA